MSWRERIASLSLGRLFKGETRTALPIEMAMSLGVNTTGVTVTEKSVLTLAVAFACINVISTDLSSLPLTLYRKRKSGGRDIIDDHDAAYKLRWSPDENDDTSSVKLRQDWTAHTLGWGNGYLNVDRSGDGTIKELSLLDPQYTQAMRRKTDQRLFYRLKDGTTRTPDNILHLAGLGLDGVTGYSPPKLCKQAYALGLAMEIYGASFYGNGAIAGGWIKIPGKRKPEVLANLRRSVEGVHRGPYNAGRIGLLEEGMDFQSTSISPEDAQFLTGRQFQAIEICRIYRVPPHKVGDYSQAHLANVEISNLDYITTTLRPWAVATETTCSLKLLSQKERRKGLY